MTERLIDLLQQSVQEVLEKMFFIRSLGGEERTPDSGDPIQALVAFEGAESGTLLLQVSGNAARSISADFLGTDESEVDGQQAAEVMCELANMICGSVLSRLSGTADFRIGAPRVQTADLPPQNLTTAQQSLEVAGGRLTLLLTIEAALC